MKYKVTIVRIVSQVMEVEIEAASMKEAKQTALDMAPSLNFSGKASDAEYENHGRYQTPEEEMIRLHCG